MDKKKIEKEILFTVYKKGLIECYLIDDETPDFIITDKVNNKKIGIEITTLYSSQASATLNCEKFSNKFIDQNKPGQKQKKKKPLYLKNIGVEKIYGVAEGTIQKDFVIYEIISLKDFLNFFEKGISRKSKSYPKGFKKLEFTNLIARDESNIFRTNDFKIGDLYNIIRQNSLFKTIINSNFQEIYLLTEFSTGFYSIPLKWLILKSEFEIFRKFWSTWEFVENEQQNNISLMLNNFCICLIHIGFKNIYLSADENYKYLIFGNTYWKINKMSEHIEEVEFIALELLDESKAENILKNYYKYTKIYLSYLNFRKDLVPIFDDCLFRKVNTHSSKSPDFEAK